MKKSLLAIAVAVLGTGYASADTWGVIGSFNNWDGDVEMTETSDGVFSVTMDSLDGEFKFRANHDWSVNYGANYAFDITGNISDVNLVQDGANFNASSLTNVTLTIDTKSNTLDVSGLANDMEPTQRQTVYLIGDPAGQWSPAVGIQLSQIGENKYFWGGKLTENQYFAFVTQLNDNDDWTDLNAHRYGPAVDGTTLIANGVNAMQYPKETAWCVPETGEYYLTLDTKTMELTSTADTSDKPADTWGVIGGFNDWAGDVVMQQSGIDLAVFTVDLENIGGEFKFRANGSWDLNYGAVDNGVITGDGYYDMTINGGNFSFPEEVKKVTLSINTVVSVLTVSGMEISGVDGIKASDEKVAYFNMQGVLVENPGSGMYIRMVNGKAEKVFKK